MKPQHINELGELCRPVGDLLAAISSKWVVLILIRLSERPKRFSELKREIGTISQKVLTSVLRDLEKNGIVERVVTPTVPPRVDYSLTRLGQSLLEPVRALGRWAVAHEDEVAEARTRYEESAEGA
ncbi:winged helix-turn-helix transcriptional regulator [Oricola cellulosilytica]|uniref:Transcriptional regulator n=1 Tax=Oricola cellulosilytica TaxID=1429082 RepID=A0A4R0P5W7_9HYPH|nr:helix-turn-helix domain-containing protein [Oricola cellulosilytica]TCD12313.1 transcriptional regulator [Oricola cellulosilytica]